MARALTAWDEHFVHPNLPRRLTSQLRAAGFAIRNRGSIPMFNPKLRDNTYGKGMLTMASFAAGRNRISQSDAEASFAEFAALDAEGKFFSINRYLFVAEKIRQS